MKNSYFKGHGLGNEYVVLDPDELTFHLTPGRIALICDREKGVGSDGVLTLEESDSADFGVRIWNPDGSEAETSGNGLRVFALYLHATGRTREKSFTVETAGGTVRVETQNEQRGAVDQAGPIRVEARQGQRGPVDQAGPVRVETQGDHQGVEDETTAVCGATVHMGRATFKPTAVPCTLDVDELIEQQIDVSGETLIFTGVSVGNPHCVVFHAGNQRWERDDLLRLGPALETHPIFPKRTNVQLADTTGLNSIRILIWERGTGETPSSGSSACAAASAAVRLGLVTSPVTVKSPGGELVVDVEEEFNLSLTEPVAEVVRDTFSAAMLRGILDACD